MLGVAPVLALVLGLIVAVSGWRGTDWPAHIFRVELFRDVGLTLWNGQWYGGHYALGYSVLLPPLAAWFGPLTVGLVSGVVATACLAALLRPRYGNAGALAACWFAIGTAVNLSVGRLPFALGLAFGVAALLAVDRRRHPLAVALALATPLASPVAGAFLGLAAAGIAIDQYLERRAGRPHRLGWSIGIGVAAVTPIALASALFPDAGVFPFRGAAFIGVMASCVGVVLVVPASERVVRIAAGVAAVAAIPVFVVANPIGGNMSRLVVFFAVPILIVALWQQRRTLVIAGAIPLTAWLVLPVTAGAESSSTDTAATPEYHRPLVDFVEGAGGAAGRVEIPFTDSHWEVAFVAPHVPIARGWERQVDIARNAVLYEPDLTPDEYRTWLDANAVRWVAVPDLPLDEGGLAEAALIERGLPWLDEVHRTEDWTVYEVADAEPIVEPPGILLREGPDEIVVIVEEPGTVLVRAWYMPYWSTSGASACVAPTADGFLELVVDEPGLVTLQPAFSLEPLVSAEGVDACGGESLERWERHRSAGPQL